MKYGKIFIMAECFFLLATTLKCLVKYIQVMVDGSASKPVLRQDTGYMVEKTYLDIAPYLGPFGAYLMPQ